VIRVAQGELAESRASAVIRPVTSDWGAVTPAMRRLEVAAGPELSAQCERLGELPVGSAVITGAGELAAQFMVHVAVRSREEPVTESNVRRALRNGLRRLSEWAIESVAIAPLGTGAGNLDPEMAAAVMAEVLAEHMAVERYPQQVEIVVDSAYEHEVFDRRLQQGVAEPDSDNLPG
jgi:O-acetyl-ADP-ribose deacetylase (regulator of RNase III)